MKTSEIAEKYNIPQGEFEIYLRRNKLGHDGVFSYTLDGNIEEHVKKFIEYTAKMKIEKKAEAEAEAERLEMERVAENRKNEAMAEMLITSGFNFDGYTIKKYSGYISGDDAVKIPRTGFFSATNTDVLLTDALVKIRRQAIKELKEAAYDLGCNAVIGVDFDYITMDPQTAGINGGTIYESYVICVTANGNAVVIEKD